MKNYTIIILLFFINTHIFAQNIIEGTVTNYTTSENIVGATVYIPELEKGTYTDKNGNYKIDNLPNGDFTIKFSFIGYKNCIGI